MNVIQEQSVNDILKEYVGNHATPVGVVSDMTGIPKRRVQSHIAFYESTTPNLGDFQAYCRVLPKAFRKRVFAAWGYDVEDIAPRKACGFRVMERMGRTLAVLSPAMEDGRIDDRERPLLVSPVHDLIDEVTAFAVALR